MEGIVKESSFSHCVEHVNLRIKKKIDPVDASRGEKWRDCEGTSFSRVELLKKKKTQLMSAGERNGGDCK